MDDERSAVFRFLRTEIFPGGEMPGKHDVLEYSEAGGFSVEEIELLRPHYIRTVDTWAENLRANRERAIAIQSDEVYDRYLRYLTGCAQLFRKGISNVGRFALVK
ncbi:class I SAM-dependent methyltransferase [Mycobacterium alsense]|uniref:Class I SAM-dependent methyltransferase n=1 Tax=Mycobacterium alsense TaxID=324058 RepID=A0AA41XNY3_9MYCO|nr:class I SAM-dependent methyltransferase [Mycobacterium alsense]